MVLCITLSCNTLAINNPRFIGKEFVKDTNIVYIQDRHYSPSLGRFITQDIKKQNFNEYEYANSNPIKNFDPTGDKGIFATIMGFIAAAVVAIATAVSAFFAPGVVPELLGTEGGIISADATGTAAVTTATTVGTDGVADSAVTAAAGASLPSATSTGAEGAEEGISETASSIVSENTGEQQLSQLDSIQSTETGTDMNESNLVETAEQETGRAEMTQQDGYDPGNDTGNDSGIESESEHEEPTQTTSEGGKSPAGNEAKPDSTDDSKLVDKSTPEDKEIEEPKTLMQKIIGGAKDMAIETLKQIPMGAMFILGPKIFEWFGEKRPKPRHPLPAT